MVVLLCVKGLVKCEESVGFVVFSTNTSKFVNNSPKYYINVFLCQRDNLVLLEEPKDGRLVPKDPSSVDNRMTIVPDITKHIALYIVLAR